MADRCPRTAELAPELALGLLTGGERADALLHVARCSTCRGTVEELAEAADLLLLLAPEGQPPAGFETAVLDGVAAARTTDRPWRDRRGAAILVAAALLVVLAVGAVVGRATSPSSDTARQVAMSSPEGREVGSLIMYDGQPSWLLVSVPGWRQWEGDGTRLAYHLRIELTDGRQIELPDVTLGPQGSWSTATSVDPDEIRRVSIVDHTGRIWCTAEAV